MSARQRNPRRVMLHDLRTLKSHLVAIILRWDIKSTVYVPYRLPAYDGWKRPRRPEEYPETRAVAWQQTARELRQLAAAAERMAQVADQYAEQPVPVAK